MHFGFEDTVAFFTTLSFTRSNTSYIHLRVCLPVT
jgi:hypothetical protein